MIHVRSMLFATAFVVASGSVVYAQPGRFMPRREIGEARERLRERREAAADRAAQARRMAESRADVSRMRTRVRLPELGVRLRQERLDAMRVRRAFQADRREMLREQRSLRTPRPPAVERRRIPRLSMGD